MKMCRKCGERAACVKAKKFPKLCFPCGFGAYEKVYKWERTKRVKLARYRARKAAEDGERN